MFRYSENSIPCQWDGCSSEAVSQVFNSDCSDDAFLCSFHRRVAVINIETYDRIRVPKGSSVLQKRPGASAVPAPPKPESPSARPGQQVEPEEWEKEAARKADAAAVPVEPFITDEGEVDPRNAAPEKQIKTPPISDIPRPRRDD